MMTSEEKVRSNRKAGVAVVEDSVATSAAATVPGQHILTRSLEVKSSPVEGVVVRVAKHGAHAGLCRGTKTKRR